MRQLDPAGDLGTSLATASFTLTLARSPTSIFLGALTVIVGVTFATTWLTVVDEPWWVVLPA